MIRLPAIALFVLLALAACGGATRTASTKADKPASGQAAQTQAELPDKVAMPAKLPEGTPNAVINAPVEVIAMELDRVMERRGYSRKPSAKGSFMYERPSVAAQDRAMAGIQDPDQELQRVVCLHSPDKDGIKVACRLFLIAVDDDGQESVLDMTRGANSRTYQDILNRIKANFRGYGG